VLSLALGYALWNLVPARDFEHLYLQALEDYARGEKAWQTGDDEACLKHWQHTALRAGQAESQAGKVIARLKKQAVPQAKVDPVRTSLGEILYLKARSLRDQDFARSGLGGERHQETLDTSTGERFRSFLVSSDPQRRGQNIQLLRAAARLAPKDRDILRDALRTELMLTPLNWPIIQELAEAIHHLEPADARALYLLARFDFDQPASPAGAVAKRDPARINKARELVGAARRDKDAPLWRTLYLEIQIEWWRLQEAKRRRQEGPLRQARIDLDRLLWHESEGALARLRRDDGLARMSAWDAEGALEIPLLALEYLREDKARTAQGADLAAAAADDYAAFLGRRAAQNSALFPWERLLAKGQQALHSTWPIWRTDASPRWDGPTQKLIQLFQAAADKNKGSPQVHSQIAALLELRARCVPPAQAVPYRHAMDSLLQAAAKTVSQFPESAKIPWLAVRGYRRLGQSPDGQEFKQCLSDLAGIAGPDAAFEHRLLQSLASLRAGRLADAATDLDAVHLLAPPEGRFRAHLLQTKIHLGQGHLDQALASLRQIERFWNQDPMPGIFDRLWFGDLFAGPDEIAWRLADTHLKIALDKRARFSAAHPAKDPPANLFQHHEKEAWLLADSLGPTSRFRLYFQQAKVQYLLAQRQLAAAQQELAAMERNRPEELDTLATKLLLAEHDAQDREKRLQRLETEWTAKMHMQPEKRAWRLAVALVVSRRGDTARAAAVLADSPAPGASEVAGDLLPIHYLASLGALYGQPPPALTEEMRVLFETAERRHPCDARVALNLGKAQLARRDTAAAKQALQRAVNLARLRSPERDPAQQRAVEVAAADLLAECGK
jgi:hypothetical protein